MSADFEQVIGRARAGDFIFADPPYHQPEDAGGFLKYNARPFSWQDQVRLASAVRAAVRRGAKAVVTNGSSPLIVDLYRGFAKIEQLSRRSVIAGNGAARGETVELAFLAGH